MNSMEAILTRRSIRSFNDKPVSEDEVDKILKAAMHAPSAGNVQPWHFIVITDKSVLATIPSIHPNARMAASAPLAILVCADVALEKYPGFWPQDLAAATQNMLLATHSLGLASVWTGICSNQEIVEPFKAMFKLPENIEPFALVVIGHSDSKVGAVERYNPDRVHYNVW